MVVSARSEALFRVRSRPLAWHMDRPGQTATPKPMFMRGCRRSARNLKKKWVRLSAVNCWDSPREIPYPSRARNSIINSVPVRKSLLRRRNCWKNIYNPADVLYQRELRQERWHAAALLRVLRSPRVKTQSLPVFASGFAFIADLRQSKQGKPPDRRQKQNTGKV